MEMRDFRKLLNSNKIKESLFFILLIAYIIYTFGIINLSLWHDEIYTVQEYAQSSLKNIISGKYVSNNHVFFSIILHFLLKIFKYNEIVVRIPSLIFGIACLCLWYHKLKKYININVALLCSYFIAMNISFIELSYQARGYSLLYLCTSLVLFSVYEELIYDSKIYTYIWCISSIVGIYTYPLFCVFVGSMCIIRIFLIKNKKKAIISDFLVTASSIVLYLPLLKNMIEYYRTQLDAHGTVLELSNCFTFNFVNILNDYRFSKYLLLCIYFVILIGYGIYCGIKKNKLFSIISISSCVCVILFMTIFKINTIPRYLSFLDNILIVFIAIGQVELLKIRFKNINLTKLKQLTSIFIFFIVISVMFINFLNDVNYRRQYPIERFKETCYQLTEQYNYSNYKIVVASARRTGWDFYFKEDNIRNAIIIDSTDPTEIINKLSNINKDSDVIFFDHVIERKALNQLSDYGLKYEEHKQQIRGTIKIYSIKKGELSKLIVN